MGKREKRERGNAERKAAESAKAGAKAAKEREQFLAELCVQQCPACGGNAVAMLCYGLPRFDEQMCADLDAGLLALGGCCIFGDDPKWQCQACNHEWR